MRNDFAVFICTHGRPNKQLTLEALKKCGYTGKVYLVLDDTDETIQQYIDNFGADMLLVFDKNHYINTVYTSMAKPYYKCILYAKCAVEDIAKAMKLNAFVIADDDLTGFSIRYPVENSLKRISKFSMDDALSISVDFLLDADATIMGIGHGGTYFNGVKVFEPNSVSKLINTGVPYNFIFRNTKHNVDWMSAYGEDDVTNNYNSSIGNKVMLMPYMQLTIVPSGSCAEGGMYDVYANVDAFKLMFFIFMHFPTSVEVVLKRDRKTGVVFWSTKRYRENTCPKIVSESYRKE